MRVPRAQPHRPAENDAELAQRLRSWADPRVDLKENGLDGYHCAPRPVPELLELGSCTASSVSPLGWDAAREADRRICIEGADACADEVRSFLASYFELPNGSEVVLTPSATDAELLVSLLAIGGSARPLTVVMPAEHERGSGSALAAAMKHFARRTPSGDTVTVGAPLTATLGAQVHLVSIPVHDSGGAPLSFDGVERHMDEAIRRAANAGHVVLVHALDHGKTGLRTPRAEAVEHGRASFPNVVRVAVDAAQGRSSPRKLGRAVAAGALVVTSGSKFYGGPPFSGAVLVPPGISPPPLPGPEIAPLGAYLYRAGLPQAWRSLRASLTTVSEDGGQHGPLLRWAAAMAEMKQLRSVPDVTAREVIAAFDRIVHQTFEPLAASNEIQFWVGEDRWLGRPRPSAAGLFVSQTSAGDGRATKTLSTEAGGTDPLVSLDRSPTVFCFTLRGHRERLGFEALKRVASRLPASRALAHLGQPAATGGETAALRIALGAPLLSALAMAWSEQRTRTDALALLQARLQTVFEVLLEEAAHAGDPNHE